MIAGPVSAKKRRVLILRSAAAFGAVLSIAASFLLISDRGLRLWISGFDGFVVLFSIGFAVFTWLVATRQPDNGVVWAMAAAAFFGGLLEFGLVAVFTFFDVPEPLNDIWVPALAPSGAAWIYFSTGWAWVPALIPILTFGVLLFPDGRLPSPKWRPVGMFTAIGLVALTIATIWTYWPDQTAPVEEGPFFNVAFGMVLVAAVLSLAALVGRFRRSTGEQRHQIKWILWGALALVPMFLGVGFVIGGTVNEHLLLVPVYAAEVIFLTSYGIAIGKYRLYDIDVVISRSFVLAVLAVFITGTYAAIVVGLGGLIGGDADGLLLPIAATAVVALAFEPVRFRAQRWANRVVYGKRATPYEVLADLTERLAVATAGEGLLQRLADLLREGVGADYAAVWLGRSGEMIVAATSPEISRTALQPALDGETSFPVSHNGEVVGALEVTKPKGTVLSVQERSLISDLAGSAGAVLGYQRLNDSLAKRARELEESRTRLVGVQDQERRRLERELHEGAEQYIVALKVKLGVAGQLAAKHDASVLVTLLNGLTAEAQAALDDVQSLAKGIYPPILESDGLPAALSALASASPVEIHVEREGIGRYPAEVEAAVYFDISEAVTNAVKHADPPIDVELSQVDGVLRFSVIDRGPGFDIDGLEQGSGLQNMADRLAAVGGQLTVESHPGESTRIHGEIPIRQLTPR